jgi:hypothetical protein
MGGLITRSFVKKYQEQFLEDLKTIGLVMTINSPMGGMASAAKGVKRSPIVVPSWRDVAAGSTFLEGGVDKAGKEIVGINEWDWPKEIPYYLIVSNKTGKDGDGTVSMVSQANNYEKNPYDELKLQLEATRPYIFNNTHDGTLNHERFLALFNDILADSLEEGNGF